MNVQKINYQKELDKILKRLEEEGRVPTLLIHSCCAPCSSYVLEYLSRYFRITVLYYKFHFLIVLLLLYVKDDKQKQNN